MSSWNMSGDCCLWDGVICDEMTGDVIELDLSCSKLVGTIDSNSSLFQLSHLQRLNLSSNDFYGSHISPEFGRFSSLTHLDLFSSNFSGQIPSEISHLSKLHSLRLNGFGRLRLIAHDFKLLLQNLTQLRELDLTLVNISSTIPLNFSSHLTTLSMGSTTLYGIIPESIFHLPNLETLDLSYSYPLSGYFPKKWNSSASLIELDLSGVNFSDNLPESLGYLTLLEDHFKSNSLEEINLSDNQLQGNLPNSIQNLVNLKIFYLSFNNFNGNVDISLFSNLKQLLVLSLSYNNISGEISSSICNLTSLVMLDLARNNLGGGIPQCLGNISGLEVLDMSNNKLSGTLPTIFSNGSSLRSLDLHGNKLEGEIPRSLANCKELQVLDLGNNHLIDTFPMWLGTLPKLKVLNLRSNTLHGSIQPLRIETIFPELRIIDLSYNAFSGNLPSSLFQHLKSMRKPDPSMERVTSLEDTYYEDSITVATKGFDREIVRILHLYTVIDFSSNKFGGQIPSIMGDLIAVHILNLSHNGLRGHIPPSLGDLSSVESLDLSGNHLSGEIPQQLVSLTSLSFLNLSHNHLQGCIPQGPQFHTFENNSYEGNDGLRGFPVSKSCGDTRVLDTNDTVSALDDEESNSEFLSDFWKAALMGYGSGLCIGLSIIYFMISTGNPKWLARIIVELEHKIMMGRRKKHRRQRSCRRRNNHL
ncbi:receptor-like protein 9DC3 [Solanum verrucosum]|uniref:receptor-like protein 9DC3 n=1 Tax=Solanum verrucosum TaxID=315347 RepID=UPI0020D19394|nr:receptor-like protein 9DC3 [Solanum verrucosum]